MLVCLCYGISEHKIKELVKSGAAASLREIQAHCQAGKNCGTCVCDLKRLVEESRREQG